MSYGHMQPNLLGVRQDSYKKIQANVMKIEYILTSIDSGGFWASPIPRPMAMAAVQARANVFIVLKVYFVSFS